MFEWTRDAAEVLVSFPSQGEIMGLEGSIPTPPGLSGMSPMLHSNAERIPTTLA